MEQAHKYSTTNRKLSDQKVQEAEEVMQELERLAKHQEWWIYWMDNTLLIVDALSYFVLFI